MVAKGTSIIKKSLVNETIIDQSCSGKSKKDKIKKSYVTTITHKASLKIT
jgi:hypothetical protein